MLLKYIRNRRNEKSPNSRYLSSKAVSTSRPLFHENKYGGEIGNNFLITGIFQKTGNS